MIVLKMFNTSSARTQRGSVAAALPDSEGQGAAGLLFRV